MLAKCLRCFLPFHKDSEYREGGSIWDGIPSRALAHIQRFAGREGLFSTEILRYRNTDSVRDYCGMCVVVCVVLRTLLRELYLKVCDVITHK